MSTTERNVGIRIYSPIEMENMGLRRENLRKQKQDNYQRTSENKKVGKQVELNFLEELLKVQKDGYVAIGYQHFSFGSLE